MPFFSSMRPSDRGASLHKATQVSIVHHYPTTMCQEKDQNAAKAASMPANHRQKQLGNTQHGCTGCPSMTLGPASLVTWFQICNWLLVRTAYGRLPWQVWTDASSRTAELQVDAEVSWSSSMYRESFRYSPPVGAPVLHDSPLLSCWVKPHNISVTQHGDWIGFLGVKVRHRNDWPPVLSPAESA